MGFRFNVDSHPGYHPSVLLKLYIYGELNHVQSSLRLEREALAPPTSLRNLHGYPHSVDTSRPVLIVKCNQLYLVGGFTAPAGRQLHPHKKLAAV